MFNSFEKSKNLFELKFSFLIITKLLKHQKQKLHFMMNRKKNSTNDQKKKTIDCNAKNNINLIIEHFEKFSIFFDLIDYEMSDFFNDSKRQKICLIQTDSVIFAKTKFSWNFFIFGISKYSFIFMKKKILRKFFIFEISKYSFIFTKKKFFFMFEIFVYFREKFFFFHVRNICLFLRKKNLFSYLKYSFIFAKKKSFFMFKIFVYFREKKIFFYVQNIRLFSRKKNFCRFTGAKPLKVRRIRVLAVGRSHDLVTAHRVNRHFIIIARKSVFIIIVFW